VHLSSVSFRVFQSRRVNGLSARDAEIGADLLRAYGRDPDVSRIAESWRGNTFRSMSEELLAHCPPLPELDLIVLAYQTPDLHVAEAAGCYLAERCPGTPVSFAVSEQSAGAPFTALRVAASMYHYGEMAAGAVFVFDPSTPICDADPSSMPLRDSAALIVLGGAGELTLESIQDSYCEDAAAGLREAWSRFPYASAIIGTALARKLPAPMMDSRWVVAPAEHLCTSVWIALAGQLPLSGPVLVADYDPYARRLYTCGLAPAETS
jgi:hypothetical protein